MNPKTNYNPDVLSCLANLSNDEVFTPPNLANQILDLLPPDLWQNKNAKFLDPVTKSGVFLREIAKRLMDGLATQIPDDQARRNHIFKNQIYGIAITELTSLLARRSVYCSKAANGKYSICEDFKTEQGNIIFDKINHTWKNGRCTFCGANETEYARSEALETYAYQFIHTNNPIKLFKNMKFDVIIGNPPYQLSDGGFGRSATPIYHKFVEQAKKLSPRFLTMIIPSRWFAGGKGLEEFRNAMLNDSNFRKIVDFENANECFPGVDIAGGICYFLWDKENEGLCEIKNIKNGKESISIRALNEFKTLIRQGEALPIIRKVLVENGIMMNTQVSSSKPFGLRTFIRPQQTGDIILHWQSGEGPYKREEISVGIEMIDDWKVITSYVGFDHAGSPGKDGKRKVFSKIAILPPGTICNETYLVIGSFKSKNEAENLLGYMKTLFFRFFVSQFMYSHHITKESYRFVPVQDFTESWTDEKLYKKYGITEEEQGFIDTLIRPME
jgi:site-specific DNA-methyltransferase (adenine-specific)